MKKILYLFAGAIFIALLAGCAEHTTAPANNDFTGGLFVRELDKVSIAQLNKGKTVLNVCAIKILNDSTAVQFCDNVDLKNRSEAIAMLKEKAQPGSEFMKRGLEFGAITVLNYRNAGDSLYLTLQSSEADILNSGMLAGNELTLSKQIIPHTDKLKNARIGANSETYTYYN